MKQQLKALVPVAVLALSAIAATPAAHAASQPPAPGTVLELKGTDHLWVVDQQGTMRWAGDSRSLEGQGAGLAPHEAVTADELRQVAVGAPLLSAPLLKHNEAIYVLRWDRTASAPMLEQVQSPADLQLLGVNADNYGSLVLDRETWEQRTGINPEILSVGVLDPITVTPGMTSPTALAVPTPESSELAESAGTSAPSA
ncbi:MAG TPA: hypothetical protein VHS99_23020 [Chloroflexota bacterium]|nr:hypothetical protein [Chloroflexota bacterium]